MSTIRETFRAVRRAKTVRELMQAVPRRTVGTAATVFNPGSLRDGGSYGVITIENGECSFTWKRVPEF